ncbi:MAG: sensor histidine kinase, partial [Solirubrobacteraceae bacterium]
EALQNIQKYAHATQVTIRLREAGGELNFEIDDDGAGFDVATTAKGAGLTNMLDRFDALGGAVMVTSHAGAGTKVSGVLHLAALAGISPVASPA